MIFLLVAQAVFVGNDACALCHPGIYKKYMETPMARSSGRVAELPRGEFKHKASGTEFRIREDGTVQFAGSTRKLDYFIGSGSAGRSFLYGYDRFLFQAPITWYTQANRWDASPGYEADTSLRWSRPIEPNCLYCHASNAKPIFGMQNQYADPPFAQNGVGCERCHGPGSEHIKGRGKLVNPAKLEPARRDAVCAQCHLTGEARIERAGKRIAQFRAGELLSEYVSYFILEGSEAAMKATSHVEKIAASACKRASGDKLWCGTCHDPHEVPARADAAAYFRAKCLTCHEPHDCRRGEDCVACHMPRKRVLDGGHGVLTDHRIPRKASGSSGSPTWRLVNYHPGTEPDGRGLGLAYAEVALRTADRRQADEAIRLLSETDPPDSEVLTRLADLLQRRGDRPRAKQLYMRALQLDRGSMVSLVNLGSIVASEGDLRGAIKLWTEALSRNLGQTEAMQNLIVAYEATGQTERARELRRVSRLFVP